MVKGVKEGTVSGSKSFPGPVDFNNCSSTGIYNEVLSHFAEAYVLSCVTSLLVHKGPQEVHL